MNFTLKADITVEFSGGSTGAAVLYGSEHWELVEKATEYVRQMRRDLDGSDVSIMSHRVSVGRA